MIIHEADESTVCFWCPGCDEAHCISSQWSIDRESVTFSPSVLVNGTQWSEDYAFHKPKHQVAAGSTTTCHSFVTDGRIQFLTDSTHMLAGQTVDLPKWPFGEA